MNLAGPASQNDSWQVAARLIARWLQNRERIDVLFERMPVPLSGPERARCQHLVLGVIRHFGRIDAGINRMVNRPPRSITRATVLIAGFELLEAAGPGGPGARVAKIVHNSVEQAKTLASEPEAGLVNAVVRRLAVAMAEPAPPLEANPAVLAAYFSHPEWLVRSWVAQFGVTATRSLLEWNQRPAPVYARWRAVGEVPPEFLKSTRWPAFFEVKSGHWPEIERLLAGGRLYLQDPSTCLPVELLAPAAGETVLDLCAAPGGKALLVADLVKSGRLVAVDLPTARIDRLKENLSRAGAVEVALVQADLLGNLNAALRQHRLPVTYDGVLLDAPCSNSGVMRHRVDVKWRLQPGDFKKHPRQQLSMLSIAGSFVRAGGRLVYSTCSIDAEENEHVVREFLSGRAGAAFSLEGSRLSFPWVDGHDGAGAFLLRRAT